MNKMKPQLKSTPAARALIKRFERFNAQAVQGDDGRWVVGIGHRAAAKPGAQVSEKEADLLLIYDVLQAESALDDVVNTPLKPGQRDALVSFVTDIGAEAFKTSDVARYLFEGRAMAAGEALAIYGDANLDRREAESALFMSAFAPPVSKKAEEREKSTVELIIKVEHPAEESVLESVGAETVSEAAPAAQPPVDAGIPDAEDAPASAPPPSAAEMAARRAAEAEIARILAVVGEIPAEELEPSVVDLPPVEAEAPPAVVEDADEAPAEVIEAVIDLADAAETVDVEPGAVAATSAEPADEGVAEMPVEPVEDMLTADDPQSDVPQDEAPVADATETLAKPVVVEPTEAAPTPPKYRRPLFGGPLDAIQGRPVSVQNTPAAPTVPLDSVLPVEEEKSDPAAQPSVEEDEAPTMVAEVETRRVDDVAPASDPAAAQVIARMSREMAHVATQSRPSESGLATVNTYDRSLPEGATLGYVIAGELATHFEDEGETASETVEQELAELAEAMRDDETNAEAIVETVDAPIEDMAATAGDGAADAVEAASAEIADGSEDLVAQIHDVVEQEIERSGRDDTPPPHPAFAPAEAAGSVGEIEAPETDKTDEDPAIHDADAFSVSGNRMIIDPLVEDDFSPTDLVGEGDVFTTGGAERDQSHDKSAGPFLIAAVGGLVVAGVSGWYAMPSLGQIWAERELTLEAWGVLGGSFLFLLSAWQLISVWGENRKRKAEI